VLNDERKAELEEMLVKMQAASDRFYSGATDAGCHPFIEFCGLMNEYIKVCRDARDCGVDFSEANTHSGRALPLAAHQAAYIAEKFNCIFGPALKSNTAVHKIFADCVGLSER